MRHGLMQWGDVLTRLQAMNEDELEQTATFRVGEDDFESVTAFGVSKDADCADGVLDHGQFYLE